MNVQRTTVSLPYDERVERRMTCISNAVADHIRALKGDMLQRELAEQVGKSDSTVSNHLRGGVNLTLRTIAEYEAALEDAVVTVPHLERPKRRRRRTASESRRVSDERKALAELNSATRRLHRLLTDVSARIGQVLQAREDLSQQALADRMGKDAAYVSRVLGGGVNLTLKTIAQFEEALGVCILHVEGHTCRCKASGGFQVNIYAAVHRSGDGGHYVDWHGVATKTMSRYGQRRQERSDPEVLLCAEYA